LKSIRSVTDTLSHGKKKTNKKRKKKLTRYASKYCLSN
jgi:hypothetical protein